MLYPFKIIHHHLVTFVLVVASHNIMIRVVACSPILNKRMVISLNSSSSSYMALRSSQRCTMLAKVAVEVLTFSSSHREWWWPGDEAQLPSRYYDRDVLTFQSRLSNWNWLCFDGHTYLPCKDGPGSHLAELWSAEPHSRVHWSKPWIHWKIHDHRLPCFP